MNGQLSAAKVLTLSKTGSYADGNGLYLQVRVNRLGFSGDFLVQMECPGFDGHCQAMI